MADNTSKLASFLKNHWIYILSLLITGIIGWTNLKGQVSDHEKRLNHIEPQVQDLRDNMMMTKPMFERFNKFLDKVDSGDVKILIRK